MNEILIAFAAPIAAAILSSLVTYYLSHRKNTGKKDTVFEFKITISRRHPDIGPQ